VTAYHQSKTSHHGWHIDVMGDMGLF